ncbi:cytochrome P450 [Streptomyces sp. NBC_00820]|uniref:cytochrome P450 n=1 Tax=Streptomyces sp. NBC_00820 TaxID=2975842 RepID=UPI002ED63575|nr:cytochrome P450 [Streptomyces sp. NBC_00820]
MDFLAAYDAIPEDDVPQRVSLLRQGMVADKAAVFAQLRAQRPVFSTPVGVFVTRHPDVLEVLSAPGTFTVGVFGPALEDVLGAPFVLARDGADVHWRERGYGQLVLAAEDAPRVRELTASVADAVLDEAVARGADTFDLIQDYARPAAARVAIGYLGFTGIDEDILHGCTRAMQWAFAVNPERDPGIHAAGVAAGRELHDRVAEVIARRREAADGTPGDGPGVADGDGLGAASGRGAADGAAPGRVSDDVLARMLRISLPAEYAFDDERINANLVGYLTGYQQNATQCVATAVKELAVRPQALAEARRLAAEGDPARFDAFVWEALRFHPFVPVTPRLCVRDHTLAAGTPRQTVIPAKSVVLACFASAMFDEEVLDAPAEFRPGRPPAHNLVLGYGAHDCVGRYAASVILPELVRRVLLRPGILPLPGGERELDYAGTPFPQHYTVSSGRPAGNAT